MATMAGMVEKLVKESEEKDKCIKLEREKIVGLIRKLEKWPDQSSTKSLESEEKEKLFV